MNNAQFSQWCRAFILPAESVSDPQPPLIMGVLNVTPDSFSDGGKFITPDSAYQQAMMLIEQGADILDIGGASSRPGAEYVEVAEELNRVLPVIKRVRASSDICISIDTDKAVVMQAAIEAGASFINDIFALRGQEALCTAAQLKVPICLVHMQGVPQSMQDHPSYAAGVMDEINTFFQERLFACRQAGIAEDRIILDPGIGFGKTVAHNLQIIKQIADFHRHKKPLLLGVSRKHCLGAVLQKPLEQRLYGGLAVAVYAALKGTSIIRTHDVAQTKQALQMVNAILSNGE